MATAWPEGVSALSKLGNQKIKERKEKRGFGIRVGDNVTYEVWRVPTGYFQSSSMVRERDIEFKKDDKTRRSTCLSCGQTKSDEIEKPTRL